MAFDYIEWCGIKNTDITNFIVKKNIKHTIAGERYTEANVKGRNDAVYTDDGIKPVDITVEFMLTGTPSYIGMTGRKAIEYFLFNMAYRSAHENKLILSTDTGYYYDSRITNTVDVERLFDVGTCTVTFRCNGARRKIDNTCDTKYHPYKADTVAFETPFTCAVDVNSIARKPKVIMSFSNTSVFGTSISVKIGSSNTTKSGYIARQHTIDMSSLHTHIPTLNYPVLVFDFENDDYYVCETNADVTTFEYYLNKTHSVASIVPYMINFSGTLGETADYYFDAETETTTAENLAFWHDIQFGGDTDTVLITTPSHTRNISADIVYYPEVRSR